MVFELHIWGPAFGLPSIDPQCLAMVAYFALAVPATKRDGNKHQEGWVLIADSDPAAVPTSMCVLINCSHINITEEEKLFANS